jgi:hypothetical protein
MNIEKGHMKPKWGARFEIITDNPFIDNGVYECRGRKTCSAFGSADAYEYSMIMVTWYRSDGTKIDVSGQGASAVIGETELRKARRI